MADRIEKDAVVAALTPPAAFVQFGDPRLPPRFWAKVEVTADGHWRWTGALHARGYGLFSVGGRKAKRNALAHRHATEALVGPVPPGHDCDHVCRFTSCVRPHVEHVEMVTHRVNVQRGLLGITTARRMRAKTHCPAGHAYDETNTRMTPAGHRICRACQRAYAAAARRAR
jgi:hypothetical protein